MSRKTPEGEVAMRRSSTLARLITVIIAVVITPVAVGLLASGGTKWLMTYFEYGSSGDGFGPLLMPTLLQALGILLLVAVVLTGVWSSAGLLAVGALALVPLAFALFPALLLESYRVLGPVLPREWIDGLTYGIPLIFFPALGAMGIVLANVRRRPERPATVLSILGLVAAPILLVAGICLLAWGIARGQFTALQQFRFEFLPDAAAAVLVGTLLAIAGVFVTRWSTFALVLPAVALIVLSLLILVPDVIFSTLGGIPMIGRTLPQLVILGVGTAIALIYLVFTVVVLRVRARALVVRSVAGTQYPTAPHYPPAVDA
ncbi:hypothetical protein [Microbacterium sp. PMB16]|uniref:hypothetical protein n=1 Tax=Microbacterium sp. PMB16 TaxID=3120157 RepID=UPI003F4B1B46